MNVRGPQAAGRNPWLWVPSLYLAEAVPYVLVMAASVTLYKRLGISNEEIAFYTSLLYLPWVVKPFWSPLVDVIGTKRHWILVMQVSIACAIVGVAGAIQSGSFFAMTLAFFWLMAIASATHDIAADGFYMLGMSTHDQAKLVGIRSTFYRLGSIAGQGLLVMLAGVLEQRMSLASAWSWAFFVAAVLFFALSGYHQWALPRRESAMSTESLQPIIESMVETVTTFFGKPGISVSIAFILLYRFAEAQLVKMAQPFLLDARTAGGLGLETTQVGVIYGTIGVILLVIGGIVGGLAAARHGLKHWMFWMALAINLPNAVYVYLAYQQPDNVWVVGLCVAIEQFGYGVGFAGYMLYLLYISRGKHETAHYAICTGFMALGMMIPGMFSGKLQQWLGYNQFFLWIMISTLPSFLITLLVPLDATFGRKAPTAEDEPESP